MAEDKDKIEKCHCNNCGIETKHHLIASRSQPGDEYLEEYDTNISWCTTWDMLECCGCETVTLRKTYWFSEWDDGVEVEYFPPAVARRLPPWLGNLRDDFQDLIKEVYVALHANSRRLAVMGARTLIDMVLVDQVGDVGSFQQKMLGLEQAGVVSQRNRTFLEAALDAGNASAHRGHAAKPEDVNNVMDIVENLLQAVYVLPNATTSLRASTPPRPSRTVRSTPPGGSVNTPPAAGSSSPPGPTP